ncbi:MAG: hypothetical protein QCH99_09225 [Candidatus Bathyarchaeota archaeon]|nr:hypothetical protein [Candidatus Bathyarchaeum tardum]WGM90048.1 MAG: hypothetical protein NUK63_02710 [Candidatus Bathyarchaeum tardum]
MNAKCVKQKLTQFRISKRALAIPMTFLMLFFSLFAIISVTYYFAVSKVNANSQVLNVSTAKQNMNVLEQTLDYVIWHAGSSKSCEVNDCGGTLKTVPSSNLLTINVTNGVFSEVIFNSSIGGVIYELPFSQTSDTGLYLKGTSQVVENKSGAVVAQLYIEQGDERPEILLRYRPIVSSVTGGTENNKPVTNVRIYVVNLNSSQNIQLMGKIPIIASCESTEILVNNYDLAYSSNSLTVHVSLDERNGEVSVPISSNANGAIINLELVISNTKLERGLR